MLRSSVDFIEFVPGFCASIIWSLLEKWHLANIVLNWWSSSHKCHKVMFMRLNGIFFVEFGEINQKFFQFCFNRLKNTNANWLFYIRISKDDYFFHQTIIKAIFLAIVEEKKRFFFERSSFFLLIFATKWNDMS